jgi:transcriptional regulator with XRE-family HTH domain
VDIKQATVEPFRQRLQQVIEQSGLTRAAFARRVGIDRSTLSQILSASSDRLPRVETLAAIATSEQVSVDWLIGLSEKGALRTAIVPASIEIEPGGITPIDAQLERWHAEAAGYKIRYVPTTLPDLLKTESVIEYEFRDAMVATPSQRLTMAETQLSYQRRPETDTEVCSAMQDIEEFARGEGNWRGLAPPLRRAQLTHMAELCEELYPTFRWFLFDGRRRFSAPLTIFGPHRAALYIGQMYLVLNSQEHIRLLTRHFDQLIRNAVLQPPEVVDLLRELASTP